MGYAPPLTAEQFAAICAKNAADRAALREQVQAWFDDINRRTAEAAHTVVIPAATLADIRAELDASNRAACARIETWFSRLADDRDPFTGAALTETEGA